MTFRGSLLAGTATAVGLLAGGQASQAGDPYFAFAGGLNFVSPMTFNSTDYPLSSFRRTLNFDGGFIGTAAVGHYLGPSFRAEGELSFRANTLNNVTVQGEGVASLNSGGVNAFGIMGNGWFDIANPTKVTPYVGGGLGAARINLNMDTSAGGGIREIDVSSAQWVFAYQLGAGLAFAMNNGAKITLDYRYFATSEFSVPFTGDNAGTATANYAAQSVMVGLRMPIGGIMSGAN